MGAKKPGPPQETPGVRVGPEGRALADQLAELTGQAAAGFRIKGAAERPDDVAGYLTELLATTRQDLRTSRLDARRERLQGTRADPAVQAAAALQARRTSRSRGRASTILTGLDAEVPSAAIGRKTLLGGA